MSGSVFGVAFTLIIGLALVGIPWMLARDDLISPTEPRRASMWMRALLAALVAVHLCLAVVVTVFGTWQVAPLLVLLACSPLVRLILLRRNEWTIPPRA